MYLLAGLGEMSHKSFTESQAIVASFILYSCSYNVSHDPQSLLSRGEYPINDEC